jgi:hypothetical protein
MIRLADNNIPTCQSDVSPKNFQYNGITINSISFPNRQTAVTTAMEIIGFLEGLFRYVNPFY